MKQVDTTFLSDLSVAFNKLKEHQLVKTGIYAWSRHPSYAGFVWWALGTQVRTGTSLADSSPAQLTR